MKYVLNGATERRRIDGKLIQTYWFTLISLNLKDKTKQTNKEQKQKILNLIR